MGFVDVPVGGFEMEVAAQEVVQGLTGWVGHFGVAEGCAIVPFIVFARARKGSEGVVDVGLLFLGRRGLGYSGAGW